MNNIAILLVFLALTMPLIYIASERDYGRPIILIWASCLFSTVCSLIKSKQDRIDITDRTLVLVILGLIGFVIGALTVAFFHSETREKLITNTSLQAKTISISSVKQIILVTVFSIITIVLIRTIRKIFGNSALALLQMSSIYRDYYISGEGTLPFIVQQLYRFERIASFYLVYVLINNIINRTGIRRMCILLGCLVLYIINNLIMGSRSDIVYLVFAAFCYFIISLHNNSKDLNISKGLAIKAVILIMTAFVLFGVTRFLFGRTSATSKRLTTTEYLAFYFGNSIFCLDDFIIRSNNIKYSFGRTFSALFNNIARYLEGGNTVDRFEHVFINGVYSGNTYTAFAKYYSDLGLFGVFLFSFLLSAIMTRMYLFILNREHWDLKTRFWIVLYGYLSPALFLVLYDEHFFSTKVSFGLIVDVLSIIIFDSFVHYNNDSE